MKKEIIICLCIIITIIIGDMALQKYTSDTLKSINEKLEYMKYELEQSDNTSLLKMDEVNAEWDKKFNILTCYLEHNELEKVKTQLVSISAGIKVNDKEYVYEEIEKAIYILEHLKDKQMLKIDNIL